MSFFASSFPRKRAMLVVLALMMSTASAFRPSLLVSSNVGLICEDSRCYARNSEFQEELDNEEIYSVSPSLLEQFATGKELLKLRKEIEKLRHEVEAAAKQGKKAKDVTTAISATVSSSSLLSLRPPLENEADGDDLLRLEHELIVAEQRDPAIVYQQMVARMASINTNPHLSAGLKEAALRPLRRQAQSARSALAHFQLEGLWMGRYAVS
jgi:hypothetical protein